MNNWMASSVVVVFLVLVSTALFFFTVTRGALILRGLGSGERSASDHVYPIYSDMRLIKMVDFQPIISAILLFQYDRLVSRIVAELQRLDLGGRDVLITSCAFGNVIPRVVGAAVSGQVRRVHLVDLIRNELVHARSKLGDLAGKVDFRQADATAMHQADGSMAANVMFFLLHELPHDLKGEALKEAARSLEPGGKLLLAEFHRPDSWVLRAFSWTYFKVFEPLGLALWDSHDPLRYLQELGGFSCTRSTYFFGNFQVIVATRQ
ncbi:MAG: methyltransferase domain-containing protein [Lysobacterales bacterium]